MKVDMSLNKETTPTHFMPYTPKKKGKNGIYISLQPSQDYAIVRTQGAYLIRKGLGNNHVTSLELWVLNKYGMPKQ